MRRLLTRKGHAQGDPKTAAEDRPPLHLRLTTPIDREQADRLYNSCASTVNSQLTDTIGSQPAINLLYSLLDNPAGSFNH